MLKIAVRHTRYVLAALTNIGFVLDYCLLTRCTN